jgi:hypothetical protein
MFSHLPEQHAIALQLLAALDRYAGDLEPLFRRGYDPELYASLSEQFDAMRLLVISLPPLSFSWVMLLITRAELTHALFKAQQDASQAASLAQHHAAHKGAIGELRGSCERLAGRTGSQPAA